MNRISVSIAALALTVLGAACSRDPIGPTPINTPLTQSTDRRVGDGPGVPPDILCPPGCNSTLTITARGGDQVAFLCFAGPASGEPAALVMDCELASASGRFAGATGWATWLIGSTTTPDQLFITLTFESKHDNIFSMSVQGGGTVETVPDLSCVAGTASVRHLDTTLEQFGRVEIVERHCSL